MFFGFEDYSDEGIEKYKVFSGCKFGILLMTDLGAGQTLNERLKPPKIGRSRFLLRCQKLTSAIPQKLT